MCFVLACQKRVASLFITLLAVRECILRKARTSLSPSWPAHGAEADPLCGCLELT